MPTSDPELSKVVHDALSEWFAQRGMMLDAWCGYVDFMDDHGERCWSAIEAPNQFHDKTIALANQHATLQQRIQIILLDRAIADDFADDDDEDDD